MAERLGTDETRRRQLLADVAHELRTPLSVIQANLEGMLDGLYPIDDAHLRPVLEETKVMSRLLDDLQTLSTAEAGALTLHREPTDPRELIEAAVHAFTAQAEEAGVRLETRVAEALAEIDVDRLRIGEVLEQPALERASPHARGRRDRRRSSLHRGPASSSRSRIRVPGSRQEHLPHVFDRFSRAPDSPGAGLGLTIAKTLVEAHGGGIRAESGPAGTAFVFTLPVHAKD